MSLRLSASVSVSIGRAAELEDGCPDSKAAAEENSLSNDLTEELPSNFGRFGSSSTNDVCLLGVVSGDGDQDEERDDSEELPESCVDCSTRSRGLSLGNRSACLSSGMGGI